MNNLAVTDPNELIQRQTRLMIIDYDITRFHSFDVFRYLLLDRSFFMQLDPLYLGIISDHRDVVEQVYLYKSICSSMSPFDCFKHTKGMIHIDKLDQYIVPAIDNDIAHVTVTDLSDMLAPALYNITVEVVRICYEKDPFVPEISELKNMRNIKVDRIFDLDFITNTIISNNINSILLSSVEFAIAIATRIIQLGYDTPLTFILCNYNYNMTEIEYHGHKIKDLKFLVELAALEQVKQYEFGVIDPFSSIQHCIDLFEPTEP